MKKISQISLILAMTSISTLSLAYTIQLPSFFQTTVLKVCKAKDAQGKPVIVKVTNELLLVQKSIDDQTLVRDSFGLSVEIRHIGIISGNVKLNLLTNFHDDICTYGDSLCVEPVHRKVNDPEIFEISKTLNTFGHKTTVSEESLQEVSGKVYLNQIPGAINNPTKVPESTDLYTTYSVSKNTKNQTVISGIYREASIPDNKPRTAFEVTISSCK